MNDAVMKVLAKSELFGDLPPSELERLAGECRVLRYAKGENVFVRGDSGGGMFLIAQGSVALTVSSVEGGEAILAVLRPPQTFGELAVVDGGPRVATATARQPTALLAIPGSTVQRLLRDHVSIGQTLLVALASLVRRIDRQAASVMLLDLPARVQGFLADAVRRADPHAPADTMARVDLRITQTEFARQVAGSRQQVNRLIVALERAGAIQRDGSRITAVRRDLLDQL